MDTAKRREALAKLAEEHLKGKDLVVEAAKSATKQWICTCGHTLIDHTKEHPIWHGIEVCLVRGYGLFGLRRCSCPGFTAQESQ